MCGTGLGRRPRGVGDAPATQDRISRLSAVSNPAMSCPTCGAKCTCTRAASSLIDPDEYDFSEQRFAASLEEVAVDNQRAIRGTARHGQRAEARELAGKPSGDGGQMRGTSQVTSAAHGGRGMDEGAMWKQEVASRLESYRVRRRRPLRERSLPLDFERAVNREMTQGNLCASQAEEEYRAAKPESPVAKTEPPVGIPESRVERVEESVPEPDPPAFESAAEPEESNVIEFPRQGMLPVMPPSYEELAEPIIDRPRILEVSEEVATAAPLGDISVAPEQEPQAMEFELPLQVASMSRRVFAGMVDALIVLAGAALFVMIVQKAGVAMPQAKAGFLLALAAPCLFWAIYEYLFLVYGGTTPGMRMARLGLITFDGEPVRRRTRRGRAVAFVMSTLALGLGVIWALLDEDTLCWHDRITRTYMVVGR